MDYEKQLKSIGNIWEGISYDNPSLTVPYQEGITSVPKVSYKQWVAFKPKFNKITINTTVPWTFSFWAPENFDINPN